MGGKGCVGASSSISFLAAENNGREEIRKGFFFFGLRRPSFFFFQQWEKKSVHLLLVESVLGLFLSFLSFSNGRMKLVGRDLIPDSGYLEGRTAFNFY